MQPPFQIQRLDHVVVRTDNIERLLPFYLALGLTIERDLRGRFELVQLRAGDSIVDLVETPAPVGEAGSGNMDHFALRVDPYDGDALIAFCDAHNIAWSQPANLLYGADGYGPALYLTDPDGNRVELKGPPESKS